MSQPVIMPSGDVNTLYFVFIFKAKIMDNWTAEDHS